MALGFHAPAEIIEQMIKVDPNMAREKDVFGATSLHVSCLNGAPLYLIEVIIRNYPDLAKVVDSDQRGPLHHAIEFSCQSGTIEDSYLDVIRLLCDVAPEMVNCIDKSGETPIDLIQFVKSNTNPASQEHKRLHMLYCYLREVSIQLYRESKKRWELEGHMENLMISTSSQSDQRSNSQPSRASTSCSFSFESLQNPISVGVSIRLDSSKSDSMAEETAYVAGVAVKRKAKRRKFKRTSSRSSESRSLDTAEHNDDNNMEHSK